MQNQPTKKCPYCYNLIALSAIKCSYCGEWLEQENTKTSCGVGFRNPIVITISVFVLVCAFIHMSNSYNANFLSSFLFCLIIFGISGYVYLFPSIVAMSKQHPQAMSILALNIFLGGTIIGWVIALMWANGHRMGRNTHW